MGEHDRSDHVLTWGLVVTAVILASGLVLNSYIGIRGLLDADSIFDEVATEVVEAAALSVSLLATLTVIGIRLNSKKD